MGKKVKGKRKNDAEDREDGPPADLAFEAPVSPYIPPRSPSPEHTSPAGVPVTGLDSPALSALDEPEEDFDAAAWANNIPFGSSPPAGGLSPRHSPANPPSHAAHLASSPPFSLAGSPSTHDRYPAPREEVRGGFSGASPALSPRPGYRNLAGRRPSDQLASSPRGRPISLPANYTPGPPPPHRPQPHFRGVSDADMGFIHSRSTSGKRGEAHAMTTFDTAIYDGTSGDVLISTSGRTVSVYKLERDRLELLGTIVGLRGSVLAAKMLPSVSSNESIAPCIAMIIHGPALVEGSDPPSRQRYEDDDSDTIAAAPALSATECQTTVEAYSLRTSSHLATLFRSPTSHLGTHTSLTDPANAVGALSLHASGRFITVSSGISGEVFIFESGQHGDGQLFRCLGKTWTSMPSKRHRSWSMSSASASSEAGSSRDDSPSGPIQHDVPTLSLSNRWLAIVPPPSSTQTTLHGQVAITRSAPKEPPGLMSHAAPAQPSVTCELDAPLQEALLAKLTRDAFQEGTKAAKYFAEQGLNSWNNYWNRPVDTAAADPYKNHSGGYPQGLAFPPTHAQESLGKQRSDPTLISIIDLERLSEIQEARQGQLVNPIATIQLPGGCNFLSFNPTGLSLFTSSAKGDVSFVWCLMRMIHGSITTATGDQPEPGNHPSVRQIARYIRMTPSNPIDVVWTRPKGEKLAILTDRGTVHIHDLPTSAFRWPPPARAGHLSPAASPLQRATDARASSTPQSTISSAMSFATGTAHSLSAAAKWRPSFSGASISGLAASAGVKGGRIVAAGLSKSMGAASGTVSNIRHMGENRLSVPGAPKSVAPGAVALLSSKYQDAIGITGAGTVRLHAIRLSSADGGKNKRSVAGERISELAVPKIDAAAAVALAGSEPTGARPDGLNVRGQWCPEAAAHHPHAPPQPLSFAEIETSTPHRPLRGDRRVSMQVYADDARFGREDLEDWVFGDEIETLAAGGAGEGSMELAGQEQRTAPLEAFRPEQGQMRHAPSFDDDDDGDEDGGGGGALPVPPASELHRVGRDRGQRRGSRGAGRGRGLPELEDLIDVGPEVEDEGAEHEHEQEEEREQEEEHEHEPARHQRHGRSRGDRGGFVGHEAAPSEAGYAEEGEDEFPFGQNSEFGM